ncbi:MAG: HAD family hydrolase [Myxococcota bacterium]
MIRGIAFDLFNTLVDQNHDRLAPVEIEGQRVGATTPALHSFAVEELGCSLSLIEFALLQKTLDGELRKETIDLGLELSTVDRFSALARHFQVAEPQSAAEAMTKLHMGMLREAVTVPSHHEAVLASLALDYSLALCSNFSHAPTVHAILEEAGFAEHLTTVLISDEVGIRKPRREIFDQLRESMGCDAREILHVGDHLQADVGGAAAVGIRTVWLTRCVRDPEAELEKSKGPRPDFALENLMDLPVLMARLATLR